MKNLTTRKKSAMQMGAWHFQLQSYKVSEGLL